MNISEEMQQCIAELERYSNIYAVMLLEPDQYKNGIDEVLYILNRAQKKIDELYLKLHTNPPRGSHWSNQS